MYEAYGVYVARLAAYHQSHRGKQTFQSINRRSVRYKWQTVNEMKISFRIRIWQQIFGSNQRGGRGG